MLTKPARYGDKRFVYHINYTREKLMKLIRILREKHPNVTIITKTNE
jgi:predicted RNA-binding protein with PUA-like domain